jgi:hypothetical protein
MVSDAPVDRNGITETLVRLGCYWQHGQMQLGDDAILEFQDIWNREIGQRLTLDEARAKATLILELCRVVTRPLPGEPGYSGASVITI